MHNGNVWRRHLLLVVYKCSIRATLPENLRSPVAPCEYDRTPWPHSVYIHMSQAHASRFAATFRNMQPAVSSFVATSSTPSLSRNHHNEFDPPKGRVKLTQCTHWTDRHHSCAFCACCSLGCTGQHGPCSHNGEPTRRAATDLRLLTTTTDQRRRQGRAGFTTDAGRLLHLATAPCVPDWSENGRIAQVLGGTLHRRISPTPTLLFSAAWRGARSSPGSPLTLADARPR
jgi:hypothetical protein